MEDTLGAHVKGSMTLFGVGVVVTIAIFAGLVLQSPPRTLWPFRLIRTRRAARTIQAIRPDCFTKHSRQLGSRAQMSRQPIAEP